MHSRIFQIHTSPVSEENYLQPDDVNEIDIFADYIGNSIRGTARATNIEQLALTFHDIVDYDGTSLIVKDTSGFVNDFIAAFRKSIDEAENCEFCTKKLYILRQMKILRDETHLSASYRFYIQDWNGWAGPAFDFVEFCSQQKPGTRLYVGAVIDYHL